MRTWWFFALVQMAFAIIGFFAALFSDQYLSLAPMLLLAVPAYAAVLQAAPRRGALFLISASVYATAIEATSVQTGFPYGFFNYNDQLGHLLFGVVPWAVSFGWVPLLVGAWALSQRLVVSNHVRALFIVFSLVVVDLVLDPGAVALGFWEWLTTGPYYTVPWVNFAGWAFSSIIGVCLLHGVYGTLQKPKLPWWAAGSLLLGNAFWVGVTYTSGMYVPAALGAVVALGGSYLLLRKGVDSVYT